MTERAAQSWLSSHNGFIPALDVHQRQAFETLENPAKNLADLAEVITLDPGMSVSLYQQVNSQLQNSGKQPVESVHGALAQLGVSAIFDLVLQHRTVSETIPDQALQRAYHQLMSRIYHLRAQLDQFISIQGIRRLNETRGAALLHNIAEFYACLFDYPGYRQYQANYRSLGAEVNSARPVFGFSFRELGRVLCRQLYLPPLVFETLEDTSKTDRRIRVIQFAADISHQAETGWYHAAMRATQEVCADYLNQSIDGFEKLLQQTAIESARRCPIDDVMPAAARLIMLPEPKFTAKPELPDSAEDSGKDRNYKIRLRNLFKSGEVNQSQVIDLMLTHLEDDLQMSRVVLMVLSLDGSKLGTQASKGIKQHSLINKLIIDSNENKLFSSLLNRPLGLWVESVNYSTYEALLPQNFKTSVLTENFFLMSLFSAAKPIGLIFCDRAQAVSTLDRSVYIRFKAAILLTTRALSYLANQEAAKKGMT